MNKQVKIIIIKEILEEYSDEDAMISAKEIEKHLKAYGIDVSRYTIYRDIENLQDFGMNILHFKGKEFGYELVERLFDISELKILMDSVSSAVFLTPKKSKSIIEKLNKQCSLYQKKRTA